VSGSGHRPRPKLEVNGKTKTTELEAGSVTVDKSLLISNRVVGIKSASAPVLRDIALGTREATADPPATAKGMCLTADLAWNKGIEFRHTGRESVN